MRSDIHGKGERALELREKGITPEQIAERLGSNPKAVCSMILHARKRREKAEKVA